MHVVKTLSGCAWVVGLTCLGNELFILRQKDYNQVEVYSTAAASDQKLRQFTVIGLGRHRHNDMTSSVIHNCLFISDCSNSCVLKSTLDGEVLAMWPIANSATGLSLTPTNNLLLTCREGRTLMELCSETGNCVLQMDLQSDVEEPRYSVRLSAGNYIVTHCGVMQHRVCVVDSEGRVERSYGHQPGSDATQLSFPTQVAVDQHHQLMFVGDWSNSRVVVLSSDLQLVHHITLKQQSGRLYLDDATRRLYIGLVSGDVVIVDV